MELKTRCSKSKTEIFQRMMKKLNSHMQRPQDSSGATEKKIKQKVNGCGE